LRIAPSPESIGTLLLVSRISGSSQACPVADCESTGIVAAILALAGLQAACGRPAVINLLI
jgi:hypothetical protein